jgi:hypothetical protein
LTYKYGAKWKIDNPFNFFDKYGPEFISQTLETSRESGRGTPNAVGKNREHWVMLHQQILNLYFKLLNVDTDREVSVA